MKYWSRLAFHGTQDEDGQRRQNQVISQASGVPDPKWGPPVPDEGGQVLRPHGPYNRGAEEAKAAEKEEARVAGLLEECQCCYSDDILPADMVQCKGGHKFCTDCASRGTDVAMGDGKM